MKKINVMLTLVMAISMLMSCKPTDPTENEIDMNSIYLVGNCTGVSTTLGKEGDSYYIVATKLSGVTLQEKAKKILGVRFYVGDGAVEGSAYVMYELGSNETRIVEKQYSYKEGGWQYVIFDNPVDVTSDADVYIGYEVEGEGYLIGVQEKTTKGDYIYDGKEWSDFKSQNLKSYSLAIQAICVGGDYSGEKQHNIVVENLNIKQNLRAGEVVTFTAEIRNAGVKTTGKVNVTCTFGSETQNFEITGLRNGETGLVSCTINGVGLDLKSVVVEANEENVTDEVAKDNKVTQSVNVYAADAPSRNRILIEEFTSQSCPNCPAGIENLRKCIAALSNPNKVAWVAHHSGFEDDIFTLTGDKSIASRFGVNFAPGCMIDRMKVTYMKGVTELVWIPGYCTPSLLEELITIPANATISMNAEISMTDSVITVTANGMSYKKDAYITVMLCQNGIIASQSSGGNNFEHGEVVRAYLTQPLGDALTLDEEGNYTSEFEYKLPASIKGVQNKAINVDIDNMYIVVLVHGKGTGAVFNSDLMYLVKK
ncbi:MAG: Omp28-related outer membrane protein [Paludibacteraceae bacterium]|nr:Omp28-related outer membrane protein [Paludibacteraceae bacterium]